MLGKILPSCIVKDRNVDINNCFYVSSNDGMYIFDSWNNPSLKNYQITLNVSKYNLYGSYDKTDYLSQLYFDGLTWDLIDKSNDKYEDENGNQYSLIQDGNYVLNGTAATSEFKGKNGDDFISLANGLLITTKNKMDHFELFDISQLKYIYEGSEQSCVYGVPLPKVYKNGSPITEIRGWILEGVGGYDIIFQDVDDVGRMGCSKPSSDFLYFAWRLNELLYFNFPPFVSLDGSSLFINNSQIESVPYLFSYNSFVGRDGSHSFYNSVFSYLPNIKNFEGVFFDSIYIFGDDSYSENNTPSPNLFSKNIKAESFKLAFALNGFLKYTSSNKVVAFSKLPEDLFINNINITDLSGCFAGCPNLKKFTLKITSPYVQNVKFFCNSDLYWENGNYRVYDTQSGYSKFSSKYSNTNLYFKYNSPDDFSATVIVPAGSTTYETFKKENIPGLTIQTF